MLPIILLMLAGGAVAADVIYPANSAVNCIYNVSTDQLVVGDTLYISRDFINNGSWLVEGLYISDNFPEKFEVVEYTITKNSQPLVPLHEEIIDGLILSSFVNYGWVMDTLGDGDVSGCLYPGDSLNVGTKLICNEIGHYQLPLHTSIFRYNGQDHFTTAASIPIEVALSLDVDDNDRPVLPSRFLTARAYPNPFNGRVKIEYNIPGSRVSAARLEIFNLLGRRIYSEKFIAKNDPGAVIWNIESQLPGGLYFYRLTVGGLETFGKLVYLK